MNNTVGRWLPPFQTVCEHGARNLIMRSLFARDYLGSCICIDPLCHPGERGENTAGGKEGRGSRDADCHHGITK